MKTNLLFDFVVDKENKKLHVKREFAANLPKVWAAWTEAKILDQWWAPKPYQCKTKSQDFTAGGTWLYSMLGPQGEEHRCRADYKSVEAEKNYTGLDAFCDENWNAIASMPRTFWTVEFSGNDENSTIVNITNSFDKLEDLEAIIKMGFKEGFSAGMENLDALIEAGQI